MKWLEGVDKYREHGIFLESLSDLRSSLADSTLTTQGTMP